MSEANPRDHSESEPDHLNPVRPGSFGRDRYPAAPSVLHHDDGYEEFHDFDGRRREYVRIPRRAPQMPGFFRLGLLIKLVVIAGLAGGVWWGYQQVNPSGEPGEALVVEIPDGVGSAGIAEVLDDAGVVSNSRLFQEYLRFKSKGVIGAGSYRVQKNMALWEALDVLAAGPIPIGHLDATVPEGLRLNEIYAAISAAVPRFTANSLEATAAAGQVRSQFQPDGASLEGLLFPDTYRIGNDMSEAEVLSLMTARFDEVAGETQLATRAAAVGLTPYQVIVVASMIEEEAKLAEERPKIARVIYNRLAIDMPLGIDATTLYAVGKEGNSLTVTDLDSDSPYNTRKVAGLPPGPIAAFGRASLEAALAPAEGPWLYYVLADANGTHAFTDSADEFEQLVAAAYEAGLLG
ncbi:MAG: endolytic transglycosylase MltG [Acidimicrobiales bacterium]